MSQFVLSNCQNGKQLSGKYDVHFVLRRETPAVKLKEDILRKLSGNYCHFTQFSSWSSQAKVNGRNVTLRYGFLTASALLAERGPFIEVAVGREGSDESGIPEMKPHTISDSWFFFASGQVMAQWVQHDKIP